MADNDKLVIKNIEHEISRIDKKENKIYFFVIDTKGVPSGSLAYIYHLAMFLAEDGYNVEMLHTEDEFEGVGSWLGEKYAQLPHINVNGAEVSAAPSDLLFIPEIYAQVMNQTKNLPCKRVAILQNYNYMVEQMPFSAQWGDFKIFDAIVNTSYQASMLLSVFPYVKTKIVTPFIDKIFGDTDEPKKLIVNIVAKNQDDIKRVVKPFYWKYPAFRWVSFRDLRSQPQTTFAQSLREGAITIWIDEDASFGYAALEAMKSGSVVMAKYPATQVPWEFDKNGELTKACVWFTDYDMLHKQLVSVIRAWATDSVPEVITNEAKAVSSQFTEGDTKAQFISAVGELITDRKREMEELLSQVKSKKDE